MVVDTSVLLSVFFDEEHAEWATTRLADYGPELCMSTVNLAETLIRIEDRQPRLFAELKEQVLTSGIRFVPPDVEQALAAARARLRFPLNLGDCFAYALALAEGCPILTLDSDFRGLDCPIVTPHAQRSG